MSAALDIGQPSTRWYVHTRRRRLAVLTALAIAVSLGFARLVLAVDAGAVAVLAILAVLVAIGLRPRYGLYVLFAVTLFFDPIDRDPIMAIGTYITFSLQTTLHLSGAIVTPFEMLVVLTSCIWLAQATMRRELDFRAGSFGRIALLFGLALTFGLIRGLVSGAAFNIAFWESRFLFSMLLAYVLA